MNLTFQKSRSDLLYLFDLKNEMHRPGIEPGSQEWESRMIPLHQRCSVDINNFLYNLY
jgi:hypothetical protein